MCRSSGGGVGGGVNMVADGGDTGLEKVMCIYSDREW